MRIGKQLLMTRGSLTTFSIANDVAKYFAIIPALFVPLYPQLEALNIMHLASPASAVMAAIIYNALIIVALIPLALRGVKYREASSQSLLTRNLLVYGLGGIVLPFAAIKLLDMLMVLIGVALARFCSCAGAAFAKGLRGAFSAGPTLSVGLAVRKR